MLRRILALMIKEIFAIVIDPKSRMVLIVPPIVQLMVFGYAATFDLEHVTYAVYNEDRGLASRDLVARLEGSPNFQLAARVESDREVRPLIDDRKVMAVLHIGPRFSEDLLRGRSARVQVVVDGRNSNTAMIVLNYVRGVVTGFNTAWSAGRGDAPAPADLRIRFWFNPNLDSRWFIIPGLVALLTLVVSLLLTALSVAREREAGTFDQMLATPLRPVEILIGKALPGFIIGMAEATFILLMAMFWFEVPFRGAFLPLYAGLFMFLLSAVGAGLMISSLSVTQQQALLGTFLFLVPSIILSGFATPIANMPPAVQYLTYLNPLRYFLIIVRSVFLEAASFDLLWNLYWPMALIGAASLVIAGWLFRRRMY
ncbi:MAG: ABC transporter permease [Candidatus Desulfacyla sp.]